MSYTFPMLRRLPVVFAVCAVLGAATFALRQQPQPVASPVASPAAPAPVRAAPARASQNSYTVVATYPHDAGAYTQGLVWHEGGFYESTGLNGRSSLRRVAFPSGKVLKKVSLASKYFGEGLALHNDELVQITWQNREGFVYDKDTFRLKRRFPLVTEGWGLTFDGTRFILSDGSDRLYFLDPKTLQIADSLAVTWDGQPVRQLNELEYINGQVWANIYETDTIVRINPQSGQVESFLDLTMLFPREQRNGADVLNGIAYDPESKRLFITGKLWPRLYELRVTETKP